jgi:predicted HNH restriction endonuclease
MPNEIADQGKVFVCMACGKTSGDKYGIAKGQERSPHWDESCMLNSQKIDTSKLLIADNKPFERVGQIVKRIVD